MKLLVIDDESIIRRALRKAFEKNNHIVIDADSGEAGLKIWKEESPDLVLLDILMPGLSGLQVIKQAAKFNSSKIVLMSAYSGEYKSDEFVASGASMFIPKPFVDIFEVVKKCEVVVAK